MYTKSNSFILIKMAVKIDINPGLKDLPVMALSSIKEFQEELKDLTELNYNKLKKSLLEQGLLLPFFVWVSPDDGVAYLMDGHQRRRVFVAEGFNPKKVPYVYIPGQDRETAKKNLLVITSQFGTITQEGYDKFTADLSDDWKQQTLNYDNLYREFKPGFQNDDLLSGGTTGAGEAGAAKKKASASDDDHAVFECVMLKVNKDTLVEQINKVKESNGFDKTEEALMHIVTNFK